MEQVKVEAKKRSGTGKKVAKDLRKGKEIPAVVYGAGEESCPVSVSEEALFKALHTSAGENVIINLQVSDADNKNKNKTVIVKEIQYHPVNGNVLHVDFNIISLTETIQVSVPIETKGEASGVKREGGILQHLLWELEIECLPTKIPEKIEVNVEKLEVGNVLHVQDIIIPEGIKVLNDPQAIVVSVEHPKAEEVKEPVVEEEAAEPELIRKKKETEEGETLTEPKGPSPSESSKEK